MLQMIRGLTVKIQKVLNDPENKCLIFHLPNTNRGTYMYMYMYTHACVGTYIHVYTCTSNYTVITITDHPYLHIVYI